MGEVCLSAFLPSYSFNLKLSLGTGILCPLIFAQLLAETATCGQPSADLPPALCCLWWDSGTQSGQQLEGRQDRHEGRVWQRLGYGGKANLPFFTAWKACAAASALPGTPAPQRRHRSYSMLLPCPAAWQPCTLGITLLDILLLSQSSSDTPHAPFQPPYPQTYPSSPGLPLQKSFCLAVSFHNTVCGRAG